MAEEWSDRSVKLEFAHFEGNNVQIEFKHTIFPTISSLKARDTFKLNTQM